jgi:hypothetical protein
MRAGKKKKGKSFPFDGYTKALPIFMPPLLSHVFILGFFVEKEGIFCFYRRIQLISERKEKTKT